jgi:hypothetical protein
MASESQAMSPTSIKSDRAVKSDLTITIRGRIEAVQRLDGGRFMTHLKGAAPDEFSHPSGFLVFSDQPLGDQGTVVNGRVELNCWVRVDRKGFDDRGQPLTRRFMNTSLNWMGHV